MTGPSLLRVTVDPSMPPGAWEMRSGDRIIRSNPPTMQDETKDMPAVADPIVTERDQIMQAIANLGNALASPAVIDGVATDRWREEEAYKRVARMPRKYRKIASAGGIRIEITGEPPQAWLEAERPKIEEAIRMRIREFEKALGELDRKVAGF